MANDKVSFKVDFTEAAKYDPNPDAGLGGGPTVPFKKDGVYKFKLEKIEAARSKSGNPKLEVQLRCMDADEAGKKVYGDILCGGTDKNGDPNSKQLFDAIVATGKATLEQVKTQMAVWGQVDIEQVIATYFPIGVELHGSTRTEANPSNGQLNTKLNGTLPAANVAKAVAENKHRWEYRGNVSQATPSGLPSLPAPGNGGIPGLPNLPGLGAAPAPAAAPAMGMPAPGGFPGVPANGAAAPSPFGGLPGFPGMPGRA
jgi:hypothetical protein